MTITLRDNQKVDTSTKWNQYYFFGGRQCGKSVAVAQWFLERSKERDALDGVWVTKEWDAYRHLLKVDPEAKVLLGKKTVLLSTGKKVHILPPDDPERTRGIAYNSVAFDNIQDLDITEEDYFKYVIGRRYMQSNSVVATGLGSIPHFFVGKTLVQHMGVFSDLNKSYNYYERLIGAN